MKKKLAIIGASIGQKPLYLKAKEMGVETYGFAWEEGAICKEIADHFYQISVTEKEQILDICKEVQIVGITSATTDICVPTVCYVAEKMGLIGNNYKDSLISVNKYLMRQAFLKHGVNIPRFTISGEDMDVTGFRYPFIVKPTDRGSSIGVMKVEREEDLKDAVERAQELSYKNKAIVEEYVSGSEATVDFISWQGNHYVITISDTETTGAPYYSKTGYHQPSQLNPEIQEKIISEAKKALTALKVNYGASDVEVKVTDKGEVKVIEVNPRMGGDATETLVSLSTGYDYTKAIINVALNQFEKPVFPINKYSGICFLSKETKHLKKIIENRENDPNIVTAEIYDYELRELQSSYDRSGYLIYQSDGLKKMDYKSENYF